MVMLRIWKKVLLVTYQFLLDFLMLPKIVSLRILQFDNFFCLSALDHLFMEDKGVPLTFFQPPNPWFLSPNNFLLGISFF